MSGINYRVHGMMQSYFTRKMTGYLDYKGIPWLFRRFPGMTAAALAAGFPGGVPVVETPDGEFMWDSTAMIHHLELRFPEPAVLPDDPVQRFLCYVLEDAADEWLYRPAVGTRWHFAENALVGGFELARDVAVQAPAACDQAYAMVGAHVRSSCPAARRDRGQHPALGRRRAATVDARARRAPGRSARTSSARARRSPTSRSSAATRRTSSTIRSAAAGSTRMRPRWCSTPTACSSRRIRSSARGTPPVRCRKRWSRCSPTWPGCTSRG